MTSNKRARESSSLTGKVNRSILACLIGLSLLLVLVRERVLLPLIRLKPDIAVNSRSCRLALRAFIQDAPAFLKKGAQLNDPQARNSVLYLTLGALKPGDCNNALLDVVSKEYRAKYLDQLERLEGGGGKANWSVEQFEQQSLLIADLESFIGGTLGYK